jgi:AcrR family transcriptional regulator
MPKDTRETYLAVGERLFSSHGYRDVNIEDISKAAGFGTGNFYNYFPSKEDFYTEILDRIEERGMNEAVRLVARLQSPLNKLKALYHFTTLGIRQNRLLRGTLVGEEKYLYPGSELRCRRRQCLRTHIEGMIHEIIEEGMQKRVFRSGIFRDPTRMVSAIYQGILIGIDHEESDDLLHDILLLMSRGLKRRFRLRKRDERRDRRTGSRPYADPRLYRINPY